MAVTLEQLVSREVKATRFEGFRYDLLDETNTPTGDTLDVSRDDPPTVANDTTRSSARTLGTLRIPPSQAGDIDTLRDRVRLVHTTEALGQTFEENRGVFLFADDQDHWQSFGRTGVAALTDQNVIVDETFDSPYGVSIGGLFTTALNDIATLAGVQTTRITPSGLACASPLAWVPGSDKFREAAATICALLGYFPPYFDNDGAWTMRPAYGLTASSPDFLYGSGVGGVANKTVVQASGLLDAPNRYVVIETSAQSGAIVGVFDVPASAPHSFAHRGRRVRRTVNMQGLTNSDQANNAAEAAYVNDDAAFTTLSLGAGPNPLLDSHNLLGWLDDGFLYRVFSWSHLCKPGAIVTIQARSLFTVADA